MSPTLSEMQGKNYDVVVIGAGINGAATAFELASAGYQVLLVEKHDIAAGASSRSSRMLHCGLRYFETPNPVRTFARYPSRFINAMKMARASMQARKEIVETAPGSVKPFTMCFPLYRGSGIKGWHLDRGFGFLRALGGANPPLDYRKITKNFEADLPFARDLRDRDRLSAIATYREYVFDWPERFCVDAVLAAEQQGADVLTFCPARLGARTKDGKWRVELSGRDGQATVHCKLVLNMTGSWIDEVNGVHIDNDTTFPLIRGTKGAHIVVRLPSAYDGFGIATINRNGMPFYCLPSHDDYFYFGPTETPFEGDARNVSASNADIDFLLDEANYMLPALKLKRSDVAFTWAGVRPLTFDRREHMGRRSREIRELSDRGLPNVFAMTAGPLMTHRSAAREMLQRVSAVLKVPDKPKTLTPSYRISNAPCVSGDPISSDKLDECVRNSIANEHARDLKGILYTRTGIAWRGHLERSLVQRAANSAARLLKWHDERKRREVDEFLDYQRTVFRNATTNLAQDANVQSKMGK